MSIENPITKERIDFRVTGTQTAGRYTEADLYVGPGGHAPPNTNGEATWVSRPPRARGPKRIVNAMNVERRSL
jgi:hypothetical protein